MYWLERSEKWGSVLPDDEDSLTFFFVCDWWLQELIPIAWLSAWLQRSAWADATLHFTQKPLNLTEKGTALRDDSQRIQPVVWEFVVVSMIKKKKKKKKEPKTKQKSDFSRKTLETFLKQKEPTSQFPFWHFTHPANVRKQACCKSLWMLTNLFSLEMWPQWADSTPLSDQNCRQQYFAMGKKVLDKFATEAWYRILNALVCVCACMYYSLHLKNRSLKISSDLVRMFTWTQSQCHCHLTLSHSCNHHVLRTHWGNFYKFGTNAIEFF